jgi:hypothetical protein
MDLKPLQVTNHQQGRVLQVFAVLFKLEISGAEVLVLAFVLPAEVVALPHIGKALAAVIGRDVFLKGVGIPGLIGGGGVWLAQHLAEVDKVGLSGGAFGERAGLPAGDEFSKRERHGLLLSEAPFLQSAAGLGSA